MDSEEEKSPQKDGKKQSRTGRFSSGRFGSMLSPSRRSKGSGSEPEASDAEGVGESKGGADSGEDSGAERGDDKPTAGEDSADPNSGADAGDSAGEASSPSKK